MNTILQIFHYGFPGFLVGGVNLALAWYFFRDIEDTRSLWTASLVSIAMCMAALAGWFIRSLALGDPQFDIFVYAWLGTLLAGMVVATGIRRRALA